MSIRKLSVLLGLAWLLAACHPVEPTPDAIGTQVAVAQAVAATLTAAAIPTATQTPTATRTPTATETPSPTNTPTLTHTPSPTNSPTVTYTPSPTLSPTPIPTYTPTRTPRPTPTPRLGTRENPLPLGEAGVFDVDFAGTPLTVQLRVAKVIRGSRASKLIKSSYGYCDTLEGQQECILVHIVIDYLKGPDDEPVSFGFFDFAAVTDRGSYLEEADVGVGEQLPYLYGKGYPPLHIEGWKAWQIRKGLDLPTLLFWPGLEVAWDMGIEVPVVYLSLTKPERAVSGSEAIATETPWSTPVPPAATPSMQLLADSQADFTGGQGQHSWEYLFSEGRDTFNWKQMTFDGSCYRAPFEGGQVRICADHGAPGAEGDIAWLYKAETSGKLVFKVTAKKAEAQGDDIEIGVYRHTNHLATWDLDQGDTAGIAKQFEVDANGGEMFFFTR